MKEKLKNIKNPDDICDFILDSFGEMSNDEVADILNSYESSDFHDKQVPVTLLCFSYSYPMTKKLKIARINFYDKCVSYYKKCEVGSIMHGLKPENYEKISRIEKLKKLNG